jgi:cyclophilin family peptidyl-prolyl cis-trans isomerase
MATPEVIPRTRQYITPMRNRSCLRTTCRSILTATVLALVGAPAACAQAPTADGLYGEFTTSLGTYWCRLEFEKTPRTVANFVNLVEGTRDWVDLQQGKISREPFYNGITFHRVITGFMNQAGSPNGQGTDGPGYRFRDEFHPQLRHNKAGILSMANAGANSNGSQFFITVEPTPWLDDKHTVFGEVVQGYEVVANINSTAGSATGVPKVTVTIQAITILRRGAAANAFDPAKVTPPLPEVGTLPSQIGHIGGTLYLSYPFTASRLYHVCYGADLNNWFTATIEPPPPVSLAELQDQPHVFFYTLWGGTEP